MDRCLGFGKNSEYNVLYAKITTFRFFTDNYIMKYSIFCKETELCDKTYDILLDRDL
ncbi:hypothetical protein LEP1GSC172_0808 [Leptospira noguchii]|uniref:Uncharacterized protein n=2 Tax=Leptospira noguchii TaxID=28182 RepID=T0GNU4_9LEPT|nr:hypothetical protein LEP1GSC172_0808 [Leptospira noguchii]EQA70562.1 hypothetical protein LEP1GSC059_4520 [Leptospira noguchii serovar Panama str. CZ214]